MDLLRVHLSDEELDTFQDAVVLHWKRIRTALHKILDLRAQDL